MAQVRRNDIKQAGSSFTASAERSYEPGGHVAQLQADLALSLAGQDARWTHASRALPAERWVRFASMAGGYAALFAGYAAIGLAILYWV